MSFHTMEERTIESVTQVQDNGVANSIINEPVFYPQGLEKRAGVTFTPAPKKSQTTQWSDVLQPTGYNVGSEMDPTFAMQDTSDADLAGFFSRPIKIYSTQLPINTAVKASFSPWVQFFTNVRVVNRITNFNLLRCNLRLRFLINGNSFYYGRYIASYYPFNLYEEMRDTNVVNRFIDHVTLATQAPHVFIDPTTSQGGDMLLPYFHPDSNMSIPNQTWDDMGSIFLDTIVNLQHANGGTDSINLSVFAWAEDVHMSIPTEVAPASLSPQGKLEKTEDEVVTGKLSGLASAAALGFKSLATYAPIAPYAMAASYAADMVSGIARLFGYSRPRLTSTAPERVKPEYYGNLANTDVGEQAYALSLDSKNAVTVDPRVAGLSGIDAMTISHIVSHESYFHSFVWSTARIAEACLCQIRVDPAVYRQLDNRKFLTSTSYAFTPFKYWTGTLNYRFQIVCSGHHRGRLRIVYDPVYLGLTSEYNVNYAQIVDIAEVTDITISIPPCQGRPLMRSLGIYSPTSNFYNSGASSLAANPLAGNGVIGIYVVNDLAIPALTAANVTVICSISGGEDFAVFNPTDDLMGGVVLKPQGLLEPASDEEAKPDNQPMVDPIPLIAGPTDTDYLPMIYCGERVVSIRPLLKRYAYHHSWGSDGANSGVIAHQLNAFPFNRGNVPNAVHVRAGATPYNYCNTTLLNYFSWGYCGWRGSIRWKVAVGETYNNSSYNSTSLYVARASTNASYYGETTYPFGADGTASANSERVLASRNSTGWDGVAVSPVNCNPVAEVELPYYSDRRFQLCNLADRTSSSYVGIHQVEGKVTTVSNFVGGDNRFSVDEYVAAGDDFSLLFYIGPPPLSVEASFPLV